jgi:hypothetical protein
MESGTGIFDLGPDLPIHFAGLRGDVGKVQQIAPKSARHLDVSGRQIRKNVDRKSASRAAAEICRTSHMR